MSYQFIAKRRTLGSVLLIALLTLVVTIAFSVTPSSSYAFESNTPGQVIIKIGETSHVATFHTSDHKYTSDTLYYDLTKEITVEAPTPSVSNSYYLKAELERLDGNDWMPVDQKSTYYIYSDSSEKFTFKIEQTTPATKRYRIHVPNAGLALENTSEEFTVSGKKQAPGLGVSFSKSSQKYKKTPVTLDITTTRAYTGKATVYDGSKKLKTVPVKNGKGTYTLPKSLKKGTHKIKVKFTAGEEFTAFYNTQTTNGKNIKVK
jgi:hypothetical protein